MSDDSRHHHCGCPRLPDGFKAWLEAREQISAADIIEALYGPDDAAIPLWNARTRIGLGMPDAHGHWPYAGKLPAHLGSHPMVKYGNQRMSLPRFARLCAGDVDLGPDVPIERDWAICHEPTCYSPHHFKLGVPKDEPAGPAPFAALRAIWLRANPEPLGPRPRSWIPTVPSASNPDGAFCQAMHPLRVYNERERNAYCAECYQVHRYWERDLKAFERHLRTELPTPTEQYVVGVYTSTLAEGQPLERALTEAAFAWHHVERLYRQHPEMSHLSPSAAHAQAIALLAPDPTDPGEIAIDEYLAGLEEAAGRDDPGLAS